MLIVGDPRAHNSSPHHDQIWLASVVAAMKVGERKMSGIN
jgi:hypothetical protein